MLMNLFIDMILGIRDRRKKDKINVKDQTYTPQDKNTILHKIIYIN